MVEAATIGGRGCCLRHRDVPLHVEVARAEVSYGRRPRAAHLVRVRVRVRA